MARFAPGLLWPLIFSMACFAFAVTYAVQHPEASVPAYQSYLTVGCLGLFVSLALASLHRRIALLETGTSHSPSKRLGDEPPVLQ